MSISFFFEMAWKSGLIAGLALLLALLLRSRAAADRTRLFRIAICLLLALPVISLLLPSIPLEIASAARQVPPLLLPAAGPADMATIAATPMQAPAAPSIWDDPSELVLLLYIGGLLMVGGRLIAGVWTLRGWTRRADPMLNSQWTEALERARADLGGAAANVRLLVSTEAESPLSWGWRRPVVLLDTDSCHMPEDADAILAHEMAHVARGDWLTLVIARVAVALFWFNPLVWLIERAVMEDAEEAADCHALKRIEPSRYAQILVHFARREGRAPLMANSIASGGLARRIDAILSGALVGVRTGSARSLAAMAASVAIATPVAALQLTAAAPEIAITPPMQFAAAQAEQPFAELDIDVPDAASRLDAAPAVATPAQPAMPAVPPIAVADLEDIPTPPAPPRAPSPPAAPAAPAPFVRAVDRANAVVVRVHQESGWERQMEQAMERASRETERAVERAAREAERAAALAERETRRAHLTASRNFTLSMEQGAKGMERGAEGMERGAQKMWDKAQNLRHRDYRERQIAEAASRGEHVTHEQLIELIASLEEGSRDMREGARDMRREAAEMRQERYDSES